MRLGGEGKKKIFILVALVLLLVLGIGTISIKAVQASRANKFIDLGKKYLLDGKYDQAILQFQDALKIDKKNIDARIGLSSAYVALKDYDKAIEVLKEGIRLTPKEAKLYLSLSDIYIARGFTEEAIKTLEEGCSNTNNEDIKKKLDEIKATIEILLEKNPLQIGSNTTVRLVMKDNGGNVIKELKSDWKIKDSKLGNISKTDDYKARYTAKAPGKDEIIANIGNAQFNKAIEIQDKVLDKIEITGGASEGTVGDTVNFKAVGYDQMGNQMTINPTWNLSGELATLVKTEGETATITYTKDGQLTLSASLGNITDKVNVTLQKRKYTVITIISGKGTIEKKPDTETYVEDTQLTLKAIPLRGWHFTKWTGSVTGTANPVITTINGNKEIRAIFGINQYTLKTSVSGEGDISRSIYQDTYAFGTVVKLAAKERPGYRFDHWEGSVISKDSAITVEMIDNKEVKAVFVPNEYTLEIFKSGDGKVTSDPAKPTYTNGSTVKLTAVPAAGYKFDHWEGDANGKDITVSVKMDTNKKVTAVFVPYDFVLSLEVVGDGGVKQEKLENYRIRLTAVPGKGSMFSHWEEDLTGNDNPVIIDTNSIKKVKAVFVKKEYAVTITVEGKGNVTQEKQADNKVQLNAIPTDGWNFDHWEGDLTGSVNPITIEVKSDKVIKAIFKEPSTEKKVTVYPGGGVSAGYIEVPENAKLLDVKAFFGTISGDEWPDLNLMSPNGEWFGYYKKQYLSEQGQQVNYSNKSSTKATYNGWSAKDEEMTFENPISGKWYIEIRHDGGQIPSTFDVQSNYLIYSN